MKGVLWSRGEGIGYFGGGHEDCESEYCYLTLPVGVLSGRMVAHVNACQWPELDCKRPVSMAAML